MHLLCSCHKELVSYTMCSQVRDGIPHSNDSAQQRLFIKIGQEYRGGGQPSLGERASDLNEQPN